MIQAFNQILIILLRCIQAVYKSKQDLIFENVSLRHQLSVYKLKDIKPKLTHVDRSLWVALKQVWVNWSRSLIIVKPETVISWQNRRFKIYWKNISTQNRKPGRKKINKEIRDLIYRMAKENHWGAPRIYSELLMLGYADVSEATVSRYLRSYRSKHPDKQKQQSWMTFLKNHRHAISAMDFFVVPTISFTNLYVFFVIDHERRKIIHFNVTNQPAAQWVIQQLRETFPFDKASKYLIFDRDKIFSTRVKGFLKQNLFIAPKITSYKSPWQNGIAERFILSVRCELLNHVVVFNENHLRRLLKEYVDYYNSDRCHLSLNRDSPSGREIQRKPSPSANVISMPKIGGLHHRYEWQKSA